MVQPHLRAARIKQQNSPGYTHWVSPSGRCEKGIGSWITQGCATTGQKQNPTICLDSSMALVHPSPRAARLRGRVGASSTGHGSPFVPREAQCPSAPQSRRAREPRPCARGFHPAGGLPLSSAGNTADPRPGRGAEPPGPVGHLAGRPLPVTMAALRLCTWADN